MQDSNVPTKFPIAFASGAGGGFIRSIPQASQIGVNPGFASLTDGFPPLCFQPVLAGGVPPFGQDMNGLLFQTTSWLRWLSAGGPVQWDSAFSTAIGGYPQGAIVASATHLGQFWLCLADNNTTNPDTGGTGWKGFMLTGGSVAYYVDSGAANALVITPAPAISAYADGQTFYVKPANANSGAATLNVNGLGATSIVNSDGSAVASGKIQPGAIMVVTYQGGAFQWVNAPAGSSPASAALIWAGSDNASFITALGMTNAMLPQTLTDAATVAWNMNNGFNAELLFTSGVGGTRIIGTPTNLQKGSTIALSATQPASGGPCNATFSNAWDFGAIGTPTFSTGANVEDEVFGYVRSAAGGAKSIKATFFKGA